MYVHVALHGSLQGNAITWHFIHYMPLVHHMALINYNYLMLTSLHYIMEGSRTMDLACIMNELGQGMINNKKLKGGGVIDEY